MFQPTRFQAHAIVCQLVAVSPATNDGQSQFVKVPTFGLDRPSALPWAYRVRFACQRLGGIPFCSNPTLPTALGEGD
ncbi:hypothetical protein BDW62DRAFT_178862 [Aspergillus aurantiobrunneus]